MNKDKKTEAQNKYTSTIYTLQQTTQFLYTKDELLKVKNSRLKSDAKHPLFFFDNFFRLSLEFISILTQMLLIILEVRTNAF